MKKFSYLVKKIYLFIAILFSIQLQADNSFYEMYKGNEWKFIEYIFV